MADDVIQDTDPNTETPGTGSSLAGVSKNGLYILIGVIVVALIAGIVGLVAVTSDDDDTASTDKAKTSATATSSTKWDAVFLTNGQVYFGELGDITSDDLKLENIYYLQVQQPLQPAPEDEEEEGDQTQGSGDVSLAKLGRFELHCPEDEMTINRSQVLFWEKLKSDSQVVEAINAYEKTGDQNKACYEAEDSAKK